MKKTKIRTVLFWLVLVAIAALLALLPRLARSGAESNANAKVLSARAETGDIAVTLAGGGTLTAEDAVEVIAPMGVEITEFLVITGDYVQEGAPIAAVDKASVMSAVLEVQDSIAEITDQLNRADSEKNTAALTAQAGGRVKAVYAQSGDSVKEVMLAHGALAVISLDGKMALDFPSAFPLAVGQSVTVTASDGTAYIGRVESMLEGNVTVTITDDGPIVGDTASVTNAGGAILGRGTLYVHSAWNVVAASGTVSYVNIHEGRQIYSGTTLMSLKDMDHTAEYEKLAAQRRDYEEKLWELFILYQDGVIKAPCKGYVSGVDKNLVSQLAATGGSHIVLLANAPDGGADGAFNRVGMVTAVNSDGTLTVKMQLADTYVEDYTDLSGISTGSDTMTLEGKCVPGAAYAWTGEEWVASGINAGDVFVFAYDALGNLLWMVYAGHNEVPCVPTPQPSADPGTLPGAVTSIPGRSGGSGGGFSVRGSYAGAAQADESRLYDLDDTIICAVTPADTMTVSITVDELDILQYTIGMEAEITVDALPGQSFVGTVTQIGAIGSNSGGSSKYTVELTLDAAPNMLSGMNASVVICKETVSALLLPAAALHDSGSKSYVYTAYDEKNDRLLGQAEVETGLSDGENVVILSGLTEGQIVWYSYFG